MQIGELSNRTGIPARRIRTFIDNGLLQAQNSPKRSVGKRRRRIAFEFDDSAVGRCLAIEALWELGFELTPKGGEVRSILDKVKPEELVSKVRTLPIPELLKFLSAKGVRLASRDFLAKFLSEAVSYNPRR